MDLFAAAHGVRRAVGRAEAAEWRDPVTRPVANGGVLWLMRNAGADSAALVERRAFLAANGWFASVIAP